MDLKLDCKFVNISAGYYNKEVTAEIQNVAQADVLEHFNIKEIVSHFGIKDLLDEIGDKECKSHFDLVDSE